MWVSVFLCGLLTLISVEAYYHPVIGDKFQIQLGFHDGPFDFSDWADLYDTDMWHLTDDEIHRIHAKGSHVVCYFSAGTYDPNRPDHGDFDPSTDFGNKMADWDEYWLNIKSHNVKRVMSKRFDLAKSRGCDLIDCDNVDVFQSTTSGFHFTADDQVEYNRWLANQAHQRDMGIGLKNGGSLVDGLVGYFDFVIDESCHDWGNQCYLYTPFLDRNKPVYNLEYVTVPHLSTHDLNKCSHKHPDGLATQFKMKSLGQWPVYNLEYVTVPHLSTHDLNKCSHKHPDGLATQFKMKSLGQWPVYNLEYVTVPHLSTHDLNKCSHKHPDGLATQFKMKSLGQWVRRCTFH